MDTIELKLDEDNELAFSVVIEGTRGEPAKVRFIIEDSDMSLAFPGKADSYGEVKVDVPSLKKMMKEGTYRGKLEVIAEERFFEPLKFNVDLKQGLKVEATISNESKRSSGITVSAKPMVVATTKPAVKAQPKKKVEEKKELPDSGSQSKTKALTSKLADKYNISESEVRKYIKDLLAKK